MSKREIIVSGVNLVNAGPFRILEECLESLCENYSDKYQITALVHNKDLFNVPAVNFIEFKNAKKRWLYRLFYEYSYFSKIAKQRKPYFWLSLHDTTPILKNCRQAVYCHNPSPFFGLKLKSLLLQPKFFLFCCLYKYIYRINIHSNEFVIVQQDWLRQKFIKKFKINKKKIIVAHPKRPENNIKLNSSAKTNKKTVFLYPAYPRVFKNFELICKAASILENRGVDTCKIKLTIDGSENLYSSCIKKKYGKIKILEFIGLQDRMVIMDLYKEMDCLLFPSKLETWGLPITETKMYKKPMIIASGDYTTETVGDYDKVVFTDQDDAEKLADLMVQFINKTIKFSKHKKPYIEQPFADSWKGVLKILLNEED